MGETARILCLIPARGGSKGVPGKNLRKVAGLPLIAHTITTAHLAARELGKRGHEVRIVVSSDSSDILDTGRRYGAEALARPEEIAGDESPMIDAVLHAVSHFGEEGWEPSLLVLLQPTSPLRTAESVVKAVDMALGSGRAVVSVCPAEHHPYWMKAIRREGEKEGLVSFCDVDETRYSRRQDLPPVYRLTGSIFCLPVDVLLRERRLSPPGALPLVISREESLDIDSEEDLLTAGVMLGRRSRSRVQVGGRTIGPGEPVFVIAEAGVNHNGSLEMAKKLVDAAAAAGADAVKFQTFSADSLVTRNAPTAEYQKRETGEEDQYSMLKRLELSWEDHVELRDHARRRGIEFLSTPFDPRSADLLEELGVSAYKISSGDLTNTPFLEYVAAKGRPMILSTGMGTADEVGLAVAACRRAGNRDIILLQCTSSYPAPEEEINLAVMTGDLGEFGVPVGYSDHTPGLDAPFLAVAAGARVIEKHFTLDRGLPGPDHKASIEPDELAEMVARIRQAERMMGFPEKRPVSCEEDVMRAARKSIVAARDIPAGAVIKEDDLTFKRPGTGIPPYDIWKVVGRRAAVPIPRDSLISERHLSEEGEESAGGGCP
ncbi:MAG: N-acetylneuraminate synthase [Thermoplasmata archaeon]|nr:N-acetylneuraminate synthase [Thermoplasmata archaeon]